MVDKMYISCCARAHDMRLYDSFQLFSTLLFGSCVRVYVLDLWIQRFAITDDTETCTARVPTRPRTELEGSYNLGFRLPTIPTAEFITATKIMQPDPIGRAPQPAPALKCPTLRVVRALCDQWTARTVRAFELLLRERGSVVCASRSMIWHRRRMMVDWILFGAEE